MPYNKARQLSQAFKYATPLLVLVAITWGSWRYARNIPFSDQWPAYEALRTTAAIILAIIGSWMSVLYPEILRKAFLPQKATSKEDRQNIRLLFGNLWTSSIILSVVMLTGFAAPIIRSIPELRNFTQELRAASYTLLGILTFAQLWTLIMTLSQAETAKAAIENSEIKKEALSGIYSNVVTIPETPPRNS